MALAGDYRKRTIGLLFIGLLFGAVIGTLLGDVLALLIPEGVVKQFFLQSVSLGISPVTLDFLIGAITFGFRVKFNVSSVLGLAVAYYLLRYYR